MDYPKRYGIIDNEVMLDGDISEQAKLLYAVLCSYADQYYSCYPGNQRLAWDLNWSTKKVSKYMTQLKDHGIITRTKTPLRKTWTIQIRHGYQFRRGEVYTGQPTGFVIP